MNRPLFLVSTALLACACIGGGGGGGSPDGGTSATGGGDGDSGACEAGDKLWCECDGVQELAICVDGRFLCDCTGGDGDSPGDGDGDAVTCGTRPARGCPGCMLACGPSGWVCDCGGTGGMGGGTGGLMGAGGLMGSGGFFGAGGMQGTGATGASMCPPGYPCSATPVGDACNNGSQLLPLCDDGGGCSYLPGAQQVVSAPDCYCFLQC